MTGHCTLVAFSLTCYLACVLQGVIQQLMARNARLVIICNDEDDETTDIVRNKPHYHLIKASRACRAAAVRP